MRITRPKTYKVNEIFYSLQGEGYWTGTPAVFLRFSLCNLRCPFCDTDFASFTEMTAEEIVSSVKAAGPLCDRVVITGGEPAIQLDQYLVDLMHANGFILHVETNGTIPLPDSVDWITCSPKLDWQDRAQVNIPRADEVKVVYTGQDPSPWLKTPHAAHHYLQPCSGQNTEEVVTYILSHPQWKLSLQTHKYLNIR